MKWEQDVDIADCLEQLEAIFKSGEQDGGQYKQIRYTTTSSLIDVTAPIDTGL